MLTLRMLGGIGLSDGTGRQLDALLRQPKHLALLAYLSMPRPGTWHRRDSLLATFWPELEPAKARTALRSALHTLRRHLVDGAIATRGDDEVSLDPALLSTDVAAMADDLLAGRRAEALARYAGDLLPALHVPDAEEFEKWIEGQRSRLKLEARKAARRLAESREKAGDLEGAVDCARRCAELDPDDEVAARRWIALLDRAGDRAGALAVYERLKSHLDAEFGVAPSLESADLVAAICEPARPSTAPSPAAPRLATLPRPPSLVPAPQGDEPARDRPPPPRSPGGRAQSRRAARSRVVWGLCAATLSAVLVALVSAAGRSSGSHAARPLRLVVLPMENRTGDAAQAYVAAGLADEIGRRLRGMGGLTIQSGARSDWPAAARHDFKAVGRQLGSTILLRTSLVRVGDSLEVRAALLDVSTSDEERIAPHRFTVGQLRDVQRELAAAVAGALFRVPLPAVPRASPRALQRAGEAESYRLMLDGWHQLTTIRDEATAKRMFEQATTLDPMNSRAWAGLSSTWSIDAMKQNVPLDVGYERASAAAARALAIDSLEGTAWANLGVLKAVRYRSLAAGLELIGKARVVDPGNPEIFVIESHLYRSAWLWDRGRDAIRVARRLDPLNPYHLDREATLELCAGRPAAALQLYDTELAMNGSNRVARTGRIRALARLGRYDDAIAAWRALESESANAPMVQMLGRVHGASGYWSARSVDGRRKLEQLTRNRRRGWVSPLQQMQLRFESGDLDGGFAELDRLAGEKDPALFRLPCLPGVDVVRGTPRFEAIVASVGSMSLR